LRAFLDKNPAARAGDIPAKRILSTGSSYAWLKISEGCDQACSFCVIPQIRGPLRSDTPEQIESEAVKILAQGVSELVLIAQDLTSWGKDLARLSGPKHDQAHNLRQLVERLLPLNGLKRLRLMYLYPAGLTEELLKFLSDAPAPFVPYFDVPLQHADEKILKAMGRPFAENPFKVVDRIHKYLPKAALRTTLITGFPGENTDAFATLRRFVQEVKFQNLGVFAYETEEGSKAAQMRGQLPLELREERRALLMETQAKISEELLLEYQDRETDVLIDKPSEEWPGLFVGRTWFQAPEVDGVTYVSGENIGPGDLVKATINETFTYDLSGLVL
jgi:tRNA-2-methylthio-N6-dimethylallyladenosine synthase/ribosomal protein S12 methylthiotransferase